MDTSAAGRAGRTEMAQGRQNGFVGRIQKSCAVTIHLLGHFRTLWREAFGVVLPLQHEWRLSANEHHFVDFASLLESRPNDIRHAQRVGDEGERRIDRADRRKKTRVRDIQVVDIVRTAIQVEYRSPRVGSKSRRSGLMCRAADRNVLAEIKTALHQDWMCA